MLIPSILLSSHFSFSISVRINTRYSDQGGSLSRLFSALPTTVRDFVCVARRLQLLLPSSTRIELRRRIGNTGPSKLVQHLPYLIDEHDDLLKASSFPKLYSVATKKDIPGIHDHTRKNGEEKSTVIQGRDKQWVVQQIQSGVLDSRAPRNRPYFYRSYCRSALISDWASYRS